MERAEQKRFKNVSSRREIALTGCLSSYDKRTMFIQSRRNPFIWVRIIAHNQCSWTFLLVILNWPIYVLVFATNWLKRRKYVLHLIQSLLQVVFTVVVFKGNVLVRHSMFPFFIRLLKIFNGTNMNFTKSCH